jgi:hypothetical protein
MTAIRTAGHDTTVKIQSLLPARLPHLKSPDAATAAARTPGQSHAIISTHRFPASISRSISFKGKAMPAVHYYLGRPARVWISAHSRRSPERQARNGSGRVHSGIPGQPGGLLARRRIAIARFGADVAAAGGIGPALAAGLDPAGYPVVPGGVPQAWERAQVYLGLCERYQELYQAQVAELHLLMATAQGCSLPLSQRRPPTDPLTNTHTGYISLISGAARRSDAYDPPVMHIGGSRASRGP